MLKNNSSSWLKDIFTWLTDVIEAANSSVASFVVVLLPFIVPLVPAWITANNLEINMEFIPEISWLGGTGVELLGFAAAIILVESLTEWIDSKNPKTGWKVFLSAVAYLFYLVIIVSANVIMDLNAEKTLDYVWVIALFCLLSVPSGILSATRISDQKKKRVEEDASKQKKEEETIRENRRLQMEKEEKESARRERLEKYKIKHGLNPSQTYAYEEPAQKEKKEDVKKAPDDWRLLTYEQKKLIVNVLTVDEVMAKHGVARSTAFAWKKKTLT